MASTYACIYLSPTVADTEGVQFAEPAFTIKVLILLLQLSFF